MQVLIAERLRYDCQPALTDARGNERARLRSQQFAVIVSDGAKPLARSRTVFKFRTAYRKRTRADFFLLRESDS